MFTVNNTLPTDTDHTLPAPSDICDWSKIPSARVIPDNPPNDVFCFDGCIASFHHACCCQWETDSIIKRIWRPQKCTQHHWHHEKVLCSSKDSSLLASKPTAEDKKTKELEWVKKQCIDHVLLDATKADVDSLGGHPRKTLRRGLKESSWDLHSSETPH